MISLKSVHSGIGQPFLALVCPQWDWQLFSFVKWPQWDAQPQKCAQWDRQGRGRADLSHCAHFWGWSSHCGHFTNEKSCLSHCAHTRARKGWPIPLCTLLRLSIPLWPFYKWEELPIPLWTHKGEEGLTYHTVHTFEAEHTTVAIVQMRRAAYPTVHTQGRGRADLSNCAHFWGWASHCGHFTNEKSCLSHCAHTRARKGWPIPLCTLLRLSIPLWPLYKWEEMPIPLYTHKGEEGLTYPTVHTSEAEHPTVAILQMRRAAYPTVHTQGEEGLTYPTVHTFEAEHPTVAIVQMRRDAYPTVDHTRARKGWPITLCTLLRLSIPLWPLYKWEELPIPLCTHKGEEGLTYPTVHTFEAEHPTVAILQMRRAANPTVDTQGRGRADLSHCAHFWGWAYHCGHCTNEKSCLSHCAHTRARKADLSHCAHFWGWASHCGHFTNEKSCLSHCAHTRARKGWPIPLCTLLRLSIPLWPLYKWEEMPIPLYTHKGEEGLTYPTVHTSEAEHPTVAILQMRRSCLSHCAHTRARKADLSHCAHFWGWASHCGHCTNEKRCLSHCGHTRARKGWPITLCTLLRLSIPLWPLYKWEELPIPLCTHKGEEGLTYPTVHTLRLSIPLWPLYKWEELPIPLCTHKGEEGLTYPTVHTFEAEHPTVAIVQMRRAAYPTVHTQGRGRLTYPTVHTFEAEHPTVAILQMRRAAYPTVHTQGRGRADLSHCAHFWGWASHSGHCTNEKRCLSHCAHTRARKGWPIPLCTLLRLSIPLWPFYKWEELPIPLWTHKGEEGLTYPTVHTFEAEHPTVAILQMRRAAYPTVHTQGRGRADLSHCAHFWGWASNCGHCTNEKRCLSHCGHTRVRKGWPIPLCTLLRLSTPLWPFYKWEELPIPLWTHKGEEGLTYHTVHTLRLSIPLWPLYKWEELPIPLCTHKGEEGLTYPTVHTFEAEHPTVAIGTNEKSCLSHCAHTRARKGWPIPLCTLLRLSIPLWPFYKWEEMPIPLWTHKGEEGLTYPTVHTFEADHPTVAILQMRRAAYPTVHTQGRGRADLSHCAHFEAEHPTVAILQMRRAANPTVDTQGRGRADLSHCEHFWGWAYDCGHCTNEKSCLSHCAHTRARKGWPIPLCTLLRLSIPLWPFYKWEELPIPLCTHKGEEGLTYPTVHTFEAEHPLWPLYKWEEMPIPLYTHRARKGWPIPLCTLLRLSIPLWPFYKWEELPIPLCTHKGEEGLTYPTVHTFEAEHPTVAIVQMRRDAYPHCGHTRARKGWPITLCTLLRLSIPLWPLYKWEELPIPLCTHKGEEGLTYPTVHTFEAEHSTLAIVQMGRDAYPTVDTQGRGRADLSHCAHFWGWAFHSGHFTNEKSCLSHCAHTRARKGWPIPLCTLFGLSIPLWPFYKWEELPIPLWTHKGEEGLTYPTVHTFEAEHPTVAILQMRRAAYPTVHTQGRGRADLSHCAHFWGWASHCGHFTNGKRCLSHCGHTRARKGWPIPLWTLLRMSIPLWPFYKWEELPIPLCTHKGEEGLNLSHCAHFLRLSIPLWPFYKWEELPIPLCTHKGEEGLTYPTVHTFEAEHPTVAILQMRRAAYPTVHTQGRGRADLSHCAHFWGWASNCGHCTNEKELPIPLCTNKGEEGLTYPTVHTFEAEHPTVAIVQMRRDAYPTVDTQGRGRADLSHCAHFWGWASHCGHFTNEKSCLSHCGHTRAWKGWPITLCTLLRLSIPLWPFYKWEELPIPLCTHKGEEGLTYPTVHTFEAEHPTVAIVQMGRDAYPTVDTQGRGRADLSHCAHFWGWAFHSGHFTNEKSCLSHCAHTRARKGWPIPLCTLFEAEHSNCGHFTNEKSCLSHCGHTRARKGWPIPLCTLLRLSIPLWPFYKWEELPIPLCTHKGEEGLTYPTVHTFEAEHPTVAIVQMRRDAYPTVDTQGRGRADLSHCAHFWGWASHCGHFTNEKSCLSHCAHTRARKGWPIPLCTLLRLSIPLWPLYKWEEMPIPLWTHKGEEGLTYPTVHTFEAEHPTVAILQMRRAAYPTVHTQGRGRADLSHCVHFWGWASHCGHCTNEKRCLSHCGHTRARKGWPIPLCTLLRLSIPLWPFYKWEELPIPLCTHKGEEGLTYPTVHTFEAEHPTVAILQMRRAAYPTVDTQGRGRADLSHCAHFWGWASHSGHCTNEKRCLSHCTHTRARKGWPIPLCTLLRLSIPLWPFYKWEELPIPLCTHKGEEGLTYPTVHTFEAEHPTVAIVQMGRDAYPTVDTQGRGRADLSHCAHFWGWASHCGHFTNEKSCLSHCAHTRARKGWPIPLCTLLRLSIPLWPLYKWEEMPIPLWTHKGEEGLTYPTVHTFEAEHPTVAILQMRRAAYPTVHTQGRGRADLSHCAHFWGWAFHCGHCTNGKRCLSHCGNTRARKGWPIPLCTLLRLSIPLWPFLQMRRAAYPTLHTQGRGRADLSHCAHFWGWASHCGHCTNEKSCLSHFAHTRARKGWPIPLCTLFEAEHSTVAILQMRRAAYPTVHTQGRGRADLSHCAHFWGWASHCGHFTNEKSCLSHCAHTRARKGWPIPLCTLLRLSIPLWPLYKWEEMPIPLWTHKGEEGLTYPTVHTFEAEHPTVAILQMRRAAYPTVHTQGRGRADLSHCAHFWGWAFQLWPLYKWEEMPIPLWKHKGEEGLTYPTVHTFEAEHPTVAILQMRRAAYPTLHTQGRGRADLSHCAHFWGWASHCGHCTNEKSCLSHFAHTRARKGWPIPLCTLFEAEHSTVAILQMRRAAYPTVHTQGRGRADLSHCAHFWGWASRCGHCTNEKRCLSHCGHTRGEEGLTYPTVHTFEAEHPTVAILQMRRAAYPTVHTQGRGRADLSHCAHFWGWASHCGHCTNEKRCLSHCAHTRARKGWPIPLCTLLRLSIPLWPLYKWEEMPIPLWTHKGEEGLTYPTVHTFEAEHPTVAIVQMRRDAYPSVHSL